MQVAKQFLQLYGVRESREGGSLKGSVNVADIRPQLIKQNDADNEDYTHTHTQAAAAAAAQERVP